MSLVKKKLKITWFVPARVAWLHVCARVAWLHGLRPCYTYIHSSLYISYGGMVTKS